MPSKSEPAARCPTPTSGFSAGQVLGFAETEKPIESVAQLKGRVGEKVASLDLEETLIALAISATTNPAAQLAVEHLGEFKGCEVHMTHMPTPGDEAGLRRLGLNLTSDPDFASKSLFLG